MRLTRAIFSLVAGLTACVEASIRAAPYQIMFLWNAYQIEIETYGAGNTWTAQECNPTRACTFDEFIKHIEMARNTAGFQGTTGVAANARELPTVQTAEQLKTIGYSSTLDPSKLYPSVYTRQSPNPTLGELLDTSFQAIQQARRDTTDPNGIARFLTLAGESLDDCIEMRRADQADALIKDFKAGMAYYGYDDTTLDLKYRDPKPTLPNGATYDEIDVHATVTDPRNQANLESWTGFQQFLTDYINGYDKLEGAPKKHATAIIALQEFSMKLQFPVDSC
ncbi:hypothetical protein DL771_005433 [Monosporascus sp. 5C6A]|nr:hypothetical protein DL771_005433 [Monosporascus sp. 5C6A]